MKQIAHNDILEILSIAQDETFKPPITFNNLNEMDTRAKYVMQTIQAWGMMATFGDIMNQDSDRKSKPVPPSELVMRVCEVVDAAWSEMRHRGWILSNESLVTKDKPE